MTDTSSPTVREIYDAVVTERGGIECFSLTQKRLAWALAVELAKRPDTIDNGAVQRLSDMLPPMRASVGPSFLEVRFIDSDGDGHVGHGGVEAGLRRENDELRQKLRAASQHVPAPSGHSDSTGNGSVPPTNGAPVPSPPSSSGAGANWGAGAWGLGGATGNPAAPHNPAYDGLGGAGYRHGPSSPTTRTGLPDPYTRR